MRAAELALKGTPVDLVEIRLADTGLSGKGVSASTTASCTTSRRRWTSRSGFLERTGVEVGLKIISAPHDALTRQVDASTYFGSSPVLELDGETEEEG